MKRFLKGMFKKCVRRTRRALPMLTLATVLASPMMSIAASDKSAGSRTMTVALKDSSSQTRKDIKKGLRKNAAVQAKGKGNSRLGRSVKALASGRRVGKAKTEVARKEPPSASLVTANSRQNDYEAGGLFSQLQAMGDPVVRERLAKTDPIFRRPPTPSDAHRDMIADQATAVGMSPLLIQAVVAVESGFNSRARSPQGALGMMQLTPDTAKTLGVGDPMDAEENIRGGTLYLKMLTERFDGDTTLALAAYHAGPRTVEEYGDVPPGANTRQFLKRVMLYYNYYLDQQ